MWNEWNNGVINDVRWKEERGLGNVRGTGKVIWMLRQDEAKAAENVNWGVMWRESKIRWAHK